MDISIIFATYKSEEILKKSLEAYCQIVTKYRWEIIVVDNANRLETRQVISQYKDLLPITFIEKSPAGKNNALNIAIPLAKGSLLFFTDNDVIFDSNIIDVVISSAKKHPEYDVFTGKILPDITLPSWVDFDSHRIRSAYVFSDKGDEDRDVFLEDVWGPNMVVRASLFQNDLLFNGDVGPNGKSYVMGSETELLIRLGKKGCKGKYLAQSKVLHQIRAEQLSINWLKNRAYRSGRGASFNNDDNSVLLFGIPRYLLRRLISTFSSLLFSIVTGSKKAKCLAYMEFYFNLGKIKQSYALKNNIKGA